MSARPKIQLSRLRQIGWDRWDPIGLRGYGDDWKGPAADEYDSYLLHVVCMLWNGKSREQAVGYLENIASEHMGLGASNRDRMSSKITVDAIAEYLQELPDSPAIAD